MYSLTEAVNGTGLQGNSVSVEWHKGSGTPIAPKIVLLIVLFSTAQKKGSMKITILRTFLLGPGR